MFGWLRDRRRRRLLEDHPIPDSLWVSILAHYPMLRDLDNGELDRLRQYATIFAGEKLFEPAGDMVMDDTVRYTIATLACLPILHLGLDWLDGWHTVIVYPGEFSPEIHEMDEAGVVHVRRETRSGEAWHGGPLVLAWEDVAASGALDGYNPVVHEIAHVLDGRNGHVNGYPPLRQGMNPHAWTRAFEAAFEELDRLEREGVPHDELPLDPYALEAPEEFFAVATECFFELPDHLEAVFPEVYRQLKAFYLGMDALHA